MSSSSFFSGTIPPWGIVVGACLGIVLVLIGMWGGYGRGWKHCEEEGRWAREQAKVRRTHLVYRAPEFAHEAWPYEDAQAAYDEYAAQALTIANETVLMPTAVISPGEESTTAWTRRMAADMDAFLKGLIGGSDEQLREITR